MIQVDEEEDNLKKLKIHNVQTQILEMLKSKRYKKHHK